MDNGYQNSTDETDLGSLVVDGNETVADESMPSIRFETDFVAEQDGGADTDDSPPGAVVNARIAKKTQTRTIRWPIHVVKEINV